MASIPSVPTAYSGIKNVETLQLLVADLSRRLENANHTIEAQKKVAKNSIMIAETCRRNTAITSLTLRLEVAKNESYKRQKLKEDEIKSFELDKQKRKVLYERIRMSELDYQIQPSSLVLKKINKMKGEPFSLLFFLFFYFMGICICQLFTSQIYCSLHVSCFL